MKPVRFSDEAREELRAAARWYEAQHLGLGEEFLSAIDEAVGRVRLLGAHGGPAPGVPAELGVQRVLVKRFPYAVVFLEVPRAIRVIAVMHQRRRPGYWRGRIGS